MARYREAVCRLCRRAGEKLFFKGEKCYTDKCPVSRRPYPPGQQGQARPKFSSYGEQLREKQKVKWQYRLLEKQFKGYFHKAEGEKGVTGENLLRLLERRLDNVVYKLNFAPSRKAARQMIIHGHIYVNGRKVDIGDYTTKVGDKITVKDSDKSVKKVKQQLESNPNFTTQSWLQLAREIPEAAIVALPTRDDVQIPIEEQLVVEFCSR